MAGVLRAGPACRGLGGTCGSSVAALSHTAAAAKPLPVPCALQCAEGEDEPGALPLPWPRQGAREKGRCGAWPPALLPPGMAVERGCGVKAKVPEWSAHSPVAVGSDRPQVTDPR